MYIIKAVINKYKKEIHKLKIEIKKSDFLYPTE